MTSKKRQNPTVDDVVQSLRQQIASHELPPGSKLLEQDLAEQFKVSRAYIREAIGALQQRGLVTRIPNRGAVVDRLDLTKAFEIYYVFEMLEGLAVRLATENTKGEDWQDLVDYFAGPMEQFVRENDLEAYVDGLGRFQQTYMTSANNEVLRMMVDSVRDKVQIIIRRIIVLPGRAETGLAEHRATLDAMRAGNADLAEQLKRANIRSGREYLSRYQRFVL